MDKKFCTMNLGIKLPLHSPKTKILISIRTEHGRKEDIAPQSNVPAVEPVVNNVCRAKSNKEMFL